MEKVIVDDSKCIGCGACIGIAPDSFDFNDDGLSQIVDSKVTDDVRSAVDACPVEAISIVNDSEEEEKEA